MITKKRKIRSHRLSNQEREHSSGGLLILALLIALAAIVLISSIPLTVEQQSLFVLALLGLSLLIRPANELARYRVIVLILISVIATGRYIYWRLTESLGWFDPNLHLSFLDYFFSGGLLFAELYAWTVLFLGFFQTIWPLRRKIQPLPADRSLWPTIDILIPTYNEPLKVVAPSVLSALALDWPEDKLNVYVLDDGCREEFARFTKEAGAHYIKRESSEGAKAGNINHALQMTHGELVTIFDCDHVPVRSFLLNTVGWFLREKKLGLLQTPHLFFTPDPVERNLLVFHQVPNEGQLFYGLVQDGNDAWNAAFFCGSCAVIRRTALSEIGGIATETVTEDAHTSLLIQKKGWNSAYLNTPLAAGLATERLSAHIGQRMRWARGMLQIFRRDNPLFSKGLTLAQRLCYFNAMLHFLFSIPRIIFLTAPLAYLYFEAYVIQASAVLIAIYALPHIFQAQVANSVMQGRYRHSFWADVYETILSSHLIMPTLGALIRPDKGSFNVTNKGGIIKEDFFDWSSSRIVFLLLVLNLVGLVFAFLRLFWWNPDETGTVLINLAWTVYNSIILGAAISVAWEKRQRRDDPRIHRKFDAFVIPQNGRRIRAETKDLSLTNISLHVPPDMPVKQGDPVTIEISDGQRQAQFPATVTTVIPRHLGVALASMHPDLETDLVYFSHSREHSWDDWYNACEPSKPLASFLEIIRLGIIGAFRSLFGHPDDPESHAAHHSHLKSILVASIIATAGILVTASKAESAPAPEITPVVANSTTRDKPESQQQQPLPKSSVNEAQGVQEKTVTHEDSAFTETLSLPFSKLGLEKPLKLRGGNSQDDIWFHVRADKIVKEAELHLDYSIARQLLQDYKALAISLNGQPVTSIEITQDNVDRQLVDAFPIDRLNFSDLNQLSFRLIPKNEENCEKLDPLAISAEIQPDSEITMHMNPLDLVNDLALFPVPFYDYRDDRKLVLPMAVDKKLAHSLPALKAAAILASWFGAKADYLGATFPVTGKDIPLHHSIVFRTPDSMYADISPLPITGPSLEIIGHPEDSAVKLLVISGQTPEELVTAATGLTS
ncbi:MAG TPA: UDP-forming cellulose synthase catalytic subunit, partial [Gammaproteobacteria bacterium]|nr:UDP-forming cellulose synthase catalytic subunit [Gammaproteobacteria bacterium]